MEYWDSEIGIEPSELSMGIFQFIAHILEKADYLTHGSSVYSSWLTEDGKAILTHMDNILEVEKEDKFSSVFDR